METTTTKFDKNFINGWLSWKIQAVLLRNQQLEFLHYYLNFLHAETASKQNILFSPYRWTNEEQN